jgi:hypothetical protein
MYSFRCSDVCVAIGAKKTLCFWQSSRSLVLGSLTIVSVAIRWRRFFVANSRMGIGDGFTDRILFERKGA